MLGKDFLIHTNDLIDEGFLTRGRSNLGRDCTGVRGVVWLDFLTHWVRSVCGSQRPHAEIQWSQFGQVSTGDQRSQPHVSVQNHRGPGRLPSLLLHEPPNFPIRRSGSASSGSDGQVVQPLHFLVLDY